MMCNVSKEFERLKKEKERNGNKAKQSKKNLPEAMVGERIEKNRKE